jgi:peroxiredoxin
VKTARIVQIGFIVLSAWAVYGFVRAAQNDQRRSSCTALCALGPTYAGRNRRAPDFELPDMNGKLVRLSSYKGKTVFLNFWTKTCPPCLQEMPSLNVLAKIAQNRKDFVVLTVSTDSGPDDIRDTLKVALNEEPAFTILFDPEAKIVGDRYGTKLFPETWIIDGDGIIRARFDGEKDWSSSLAVEIGEMVAKPLACPIEFAEGMPRGKFAGICMEDS